MYQIEGHQPPFKRIRTDRPEIRDVELRRRRAQNDRRLKSIFESIFDRYEKDFEGIGDEIDLETGEIVVDNGHVSGLGYRRDVFGHDGGSDVDSESEEPEEHRTLGATIDVYNDDVIEDGRVPGIHSSGPRNVTPRMSALKKPPTPRLASASPLQHHHDYEDELGMGSTASYSLPPGPTKRHNPWLLQSSEFTRPSISTSPTWATPDLPMSTPRHFHRKLNALPAKLPYWKPPNGKTFTKPKTPIVPRRSPALNLIRSKNAPNSADALSVENQRHGQRKIMACETSPCQSENDELGTPDFSQGIPARNAGRSRTETRFSDGHSVGPGHVPTPSDSPHDLKGKKTEPVQDVASALATPISSRSLSLGTRSPPLDNSPSVKVVSPISSREIHIQTIDSLSTAIGSLPSTEQTYVRVRRPKRHTRRRLERFGARDMSEDIQHALVPNLSAKDMSPAPSLKERLSDCESVVRELPDSDSPLPSQPQFEPGSGPPARVLDVQAPDQILLSNRVMSRKSPPEPDRAAKGDERPSPILVQKHSAPQSLRNEIDHGVQIKVQDLSSRISGVKVVIPLRKEHASIPYRSLDRCFLRDEGKADAVDTTSRTQSPQENPEPYRMLASKIDSKSGGPDEHQVTEIPDSQPFRESLYRNCDTDVDLGQKIVHGFIVPGGVLERRSIPNSPWVKPASSDSLAVPCTPTAKLTPDTKRVNEQQSHSLRPPNTPKPQSATAISLSELWDDSDDDLNAPLSSARPARRSKPGRSGVPIRKSIVSDMASCSDDELA